MGEGLPRACVCAWCAEMPWFGSVKAGKKYWVAEDGRRSATTGRRDGTRRAGRHNDGAPPPPPAGILKRSGRPRFVSYQFEDGMVPQEMAAAVPMPNEQKVNAMFTEMVVRIYYMCVCVHCNVH